MRRLDACALLLLVAGCGRVDREAIVLTVDETYVASVAAAPGAGFASPDGLLWADGTLYVADEGGSALKAWRPGNAPRTLADSRSGLASPEDLVRDGRGNIYFSDDTSGGLWRTDAAGGARRIAGAEQGVGATEGAVLAPSGEVLVGDAAGHRVLAVSPEGNVRVLLGADAGIAKPESMAFDATGNLYIADNEGDILYLRDRQGRLHRTIAGRKGFSPESLHYAAGALFITDSKHGKLHRYTPDDGLETLALFGGALANVQGIASDPSGTLYLSVQSDLKGGRGYILRLSPRS